jgi:DNA-binding transcriptional regulator YbjK
MPANHDQLALLPDPDDVRALIALLESHVGLSQQWAGSLLSTVVRCHYVYSVNVTSTKVRALDAAIELVGTEGLRALTHVRIDERAGLPKGSTSNYFRTRAALLSGVVERIVERELPSIGVAFSPASIEQLVDALCGVFQYVTGPNRVVTTARLVLFMEGSHDATLREALTRGPAAMEAALVPALAQLGARDPVVAWTAIAACSEGLLLHNIARHDDADPRPALDLLVRAALA